MGYPSQLGDWTLGAARKPKAKATRQVARVTFAQAKARQNLRGQRARAADTAVQQSAVRAAAARARPTRANKAAAQRAATTAISAVSQAENMRVKLKQNVVKAALSTAKSAGLKLPPATKKKLVTAAARSGIGTAVKAVGSLIPGGGAVGALLSTGLLKKFKIKNPFAKKKKKPQLGVPGNFPPTEADPNGDGITTTGTVTPGAAAEVASGAATPAKPGTPAAAIPLPPGGPGDVGGGGGGSILYPGSGAEEFATPGRRPLPVFLPPDTDSPLPGAGGGSVNAGGQTIPAPSGGGERVTASAGGDVALSEKSGLSLTSPAVLIGAGAGLLLLISMMGSGSRRRS